jgi:hypothetical protein
MSNNPEYTFYLEYYDQPDSTSKQCVKGIDDNYILVDNIQVGDAIKTDISLNGVNTWNVASKTLTTDTYVTFKLDSKKLMCSSNANFANSTTKQLINVSEITDGMMLGDKVVSEKQVNIDAEIYQINLENTVLVLMGK